MDNPDARDAARRLAEVEANLERMKDSLRSIEAGVSSLNAKVDQILEWPSARYRGAIWAMVAIGIAAALSLLFKL